MNIDNVDFSNVDPKDLVAIRTGIRQAFIRSKYRKAFVDLHRIELPKYKKDGTLAKAPHVRFKCVDCTELFKGDEINVDHIKKVGSFKDILDIKEFFFAVFCCYSNLQILCKGCHTIKTKKERALDAWIRALAKTI